MKIFIRPPGGAPILDMTPDGAYREVPASMGTRIIQVAVVVAVLAAAVGIAALALWFALMLIPVAIAAGLIAYAAFRFKLWRDGISFRR
jgi:hypothetical protein